MKFHRIASAVIAIGALAATGLAHADLYPDFTVDPSAYAPGKAAFTADKITGNYAEYITFGVGTFDISLKFQAGQFVADEGSNPLFNSDTGLTVQYGLYALFQGKGTFSTVGGLTSFSLTPNASTFNLYIDKDNNTRFTDPATGASPFTTTGTTGSDDITIASGKGLSGTGNVSCTTGNNCGSFGQTTSFNLINPAGTSFFIQPRPFYDLSMQSGQFNGFTVSPGNTTKLNGSMDVIFDRVPEPSSIALVGAAFVGLSVAARRKKV